MKNSYFRFKQFTVNQEHAAMKVTTDGCLFGAWVANEIQNIPVNAILDIGTGTGLLSLMIAQKNQAFIDAVEVDKEAAMQARQNFLDSPWHDRITLINARIQEMQLSKTYDIVISNPPFYEKEIPSSIGKKNIAHHGEGLLLNELPGILKKTTRPEGQFFLMLPYKRLKETEAIFKKNKLGIEKIILVKQSGSHDFFRFFIKGNVHASIDCEKKELSIRDENNKEYSAEFRLLLKDYYLNLD